MGQAEAILGRLGCPGVVFQVTEGGDVEKAADELLQAVSQRLLRE